MPRKQRIHRRCQRSDDTDRWMVTDPVGLAFAVGSARSDEGVPLSESECRTGAAMLGAWLLERYRLFFLPEEIEEACIKLASDDGYDEFFELLGGNV